MDLSKHEYKHNRKQYFWLSEEAKKYRGISEDLPLSNIVAVDFIHYLLQPKGKYVLDYGCYEGDSTERLSQVGAKCVVGVDINKKTIEIAKAKHSDNDSLHFQSIDRGQSIPLGQLPMQNIQFDVASATFVHPVISDKKTLVRMFSHLYSALKAGGYIALLGLHENSFYTERTFKHYRHKLPDQGVYRDGEPFPNRIIMNDGRVISFYDYCWTESTLHELAANAGFTHIESIGLTTDLPASRGRHIRESIMSVKDETGVDFKDQPEFQVPLYQVIFAQKA